MYAVLVSRWKSSPGRSILKVRMIGPIVPQVVEHSLDPLSEMLARLKPQSYSAGGFAVHGEIGIHFPKHQGIKCYAMLAGECWLALDGEYEPVMLRAGDCFVLPRGLPFRLATNLSVEPVHYSVAKDRFGMCQQPPDFTAEGVRYIVGGHFALTGAHAEMLLQALPPVVHLRSEADKAAMRWSMDRMREELRQPQAGGALIVQQIAYMMLIQALRLHLNDGARTGPGWLSALADGQMRLAIAAMHQEPGRRWTLESLAASIGMSRSVFAERFRQVVGVTPMEYLTRWRMMLAADRLQESAEGLASIAQSLGYESESAFGKAFRRTMGCSPREHVRRVRKA